MTATKRQVFEMDPKGALQTVLELCADEAWMACFVTSKEHFSCAIGATNILCINDATGAFDRLEAFQQKSKSPIAGYLGYDLKNDLFRTSSKNIDLLDFPVAVFFEPEFWLEAADGRISLTTHQAHPGRDEDTPMALFAERLKTHSRMPARQPSTARAPIALIARCSREAYLSGARELMEHIQQGDVYEVNYCMQFAGKAPNFDSLHTFMALQSRTEAPFSVFARMGSYQLLCASPERFLRNEGGKLLSQPIKGTARRNADSLIDTELKEALRRDPKEQSENVMIVDLVRNDLSKVALPGSVKVEDLFGVYSFKTVHHMESSISAKLHPNSSPWDAIKACFPMGSMTGAPKLSALQLIDRHENFRRGLYSGAFGKIHPDGDFDFNVVIRSLLYHSDKKAITLSVGSALTSAASPEKEYEECLLKASALMEVLNPQLASYEIAATL